jgi:predicted dehydrogenase
MCVVTREHAHLGAVKAVLAAGKPVLIKKPVVSTDDEAEAMLAAAAEASSFIMPSHVMRLDPRFTFLCQRIQAGGELEGSAPQLSPFRSSSGSLFV